MATEQLIIRVTESGTRRVARDLGNTAKEAGTAGKRVNFLNSTLRRLAAIITTGVVIRLGNEFQTLQNRLRVVTNSTEELTRATESLFNIARETRTSIGINTEAFSRFALSLREVGVSQEELLQLTRSVNQAIVISGATAQEARAGLIQFAQGLASGTLRGDELRSVLEQLPVIADVIGRRLGVTRGALRQLAAQGKITADVILKAFQDARQELEERFAKTVPTVAQSFEVLRSRFVQFLGEVEAATGIFAGFGAVLRLIADNLTLVATTGLIVGFIPALGLATKALGVFKIAGGVALVPFNIGLGIATKGLIALRLAIAANPIGALAVASIAAGFAIGKLIQELRGTEEQFDKTGNALDDISKKIEDNIKLTKEEIQVLKDRSAEADIFFGRLGTTVTRTKAAIRANELLVKAEKIRTNLLDTQGVAILNILEVTNRQIVTLDKLGQARRVDQQLDRVGQQLKKAGIKLFSDESIILRETLRARFKDIDSLRQQARVLEGIIRPQEAFTTAQAALKRGVDESIVSLTKATELLRNYELAALRASLSSAEFANSQQVADIALAGATDSIRNFNFEAQATQGVAQFLKNISDISGDVASGLTNAFDSATGALADFAASAFQNTEDLKAAFSSLLADLGKAILQVIIKTLILKAIQASLGGVAGTTGGFLTTALGGTATPAPGAQAGGPVNALRPIRVGEQGPEILVPPSRGRIIPAGETAAMAAPPEVNVNIINATDPEQVTTALGMPEGKRAIFNVIAENPGAMRSILGGAA